MSSRPALVSRSPSSGLHTVNWLRLPPIQRGPKHSTPSLKRVSISQRFTEIFLVFPRGVSETTSRRQRRLGGSVRTSLIYCSNAPGGSASPPVASTEAPVWVRPSQLYSSAAWPASVL